MNWKFWRRQEPGEQAAAQPKEKTRGPRELPQQVGRYLVVQEKMDPDLVWELRCVERPQDESDRRIFDFRLFSPNQVRQAGVTIKGYRSLDGQDQLIQYFGWYDRKGQDIHVEHGAAYQSA